ncbi:30S ribosomal protein S16 [Candidatus Poriferisocius sp.]|uniref:30S ribosomal protein S16 n=1 Tax=Candidatus Poriferisocius sp. TaxID=3101276 RepID=UPI003B01AC53
MRMGKKKQPTYRVVAADSRKARNGRFIEILGTYNPRMEPSQVEIDNERALHWLRHGAQPSERVQKLLAISGAWAEFTGGGGSAQEVDQRPAMVTTAASAEAETTTGDAGDSVAETDEPGDVQSANAGEDAGDSVTDKDQAAEQDTEKAEGGET